MAHDAATRARLRELYIGGLSFARAARELGVADSTARAWAAQDRASSQCWKAARAAARQAQGALPAPAAEALERIEAAIGDGTAGTHRDLVEITIAAAGEFSLLRELMSGLRREIRLGFTGLVAVAAIFGAVLTVLR